jgi:hypothetical protein
MHKMQIYAINPFPKSDKKMLCSVQIEMLTFDAPLSLVGKGGHALLLQGGRLARALTIRSFLRARRVGDPAQPTVAEPGEVHRQFNFKFHPTIQWVTEPKNMNQSTGPADWDPRCASESSESSGQAVWVRTPTTLTYTKCAFFKFPPLAI